MRDDIAHIKGQAVALIVGIAYVLVLVLAIGSRAADPIDLDIQPDLQRIIDAREGVELESIDARLNQELGRWHHNRHRREMVRDRWLAVPPHDEAPVRRLSVGSRAQ